MFSAYTLAKRIHTVSRFTPKINSLNDLFPQTYDPPKAAKAPNAIRFGILGAAAIAPLALINPARSHEEVIIVAVAARNKEKAETFAKQYAIPKVYGGPSGYQGGLFQADFFSCY